VSNSSSGGTPAPRFRDFPRFPRRSDSGVQLRRPESAARAARRGRLEPVQEVPTDASMGCLWVVKWYETLLTGEDGGQLSTWAIERAVRKARGEVEASLRASAITTYGTTSPAC
jgi:hypothetical protein